MDRKVEQDLARLLLTTKVKAKSWINERQAVTKRLLEIRNMANSLLAEIGHGTTGRARRHGAAKGAGAPIKRHLSAQARKAISDAQKRRWAAVRAAKKR